MELFVLYLFAFLTAWLTTALVLRAARRLLTPFFLDTPSGLKTHPTPTPVLGGLGIFVGSFLALLLIRLLTNFPTGTLHYLRGVFIGGTLIFALGLADDFKKPNGLSVSVKLATQALAAWALIYYGGGILVFSHPLVNWVFSFLWLVGLTNAFNLLDIVDGLCVSQAVVATLGLFVIALPSEFLYVNFAALALLGACLAFWPHNHAKNKIFLGDSGATFLGFMVAALSMGTAYSQRVTFGFLAPLLIAAVPIYDTFFVSLARVLKGKNPLRGSKDHLALRLVRAGKTPRQVLLIFVCAALVANAGGYILTVCSGAVACGVLAAALLLGAWITYKGLQLPS